MSTRARKKPERISRFISRFMLSDARLELRDQGMLAVGLEDVTDIQADLEQALAQV